uniref:Secreted protein n=1 Tax=Anguilla anguilla TaxID=7936 RepID=A0A0E9XSW7_ANGAN
MHSLFAVYFYLTAPCMLAETIFLSEQMPTSPTLRANHQQLCGPHPSRQNKILTSVQKYEMPLHTVVFHSPIQSASQINKGI